MHHKTIALILALAFSILAIPNVQAKAECGNGKVEYPEECDDGNKNNYDDCTNTCRHPVCGDGMLSAGEACDNGANNSDSTPNACRTDCRKPYCGDGVIDRGEQCDDGNNGDRPNGCRSNCTLPRCGDGVVDNGTRTQPPIKTFTEQCDDGNKNNDDGCNTSCQKCEILDKTGNLTITGNTEICSDVFQVDDDGDYGVITIKRNGVTLDCNGAELKGDGRGYGVYVYRARNVVIKNCKIRGYEVGIRLEDAANATLTGNRVCGNSRTDIELVDTPNGQGRKNACKNSGGWNDSGSNGCSEQLVSCDFNTPGMRTRKPRPTTSEQQGTDEQQTKELAPAILRRLLTRPPQN